MRVLWAEDQFYSLFTITKIELATLGVEITVADNGVEALEFLENNTYDLIITDLQMPKMGGEEFLTHLWRSYPEIPTALCSFTSDPELSGLVNFTINKRNDAHTMAENVWEILEEIRDGKEKLDKLIVVDNETHSTEE